MSSSLTASFSPPALDRYLPILLFAGAVVPLIFRLDTAGLGAGFEAVDVARSIAEHGQFANPYASWPTGLTAHTAPLYPAFLALLIKIFGFSARFSLVVTVLSAMVHGLNTMLMPRVSELFFGDRRPGLWAALLTIVLPLYLLFPQFEVIYISASLMLFCLFSHTAMVRGGSWQGLRAGVALGFVALLNPASLTVTLPWLAFASWRYLRQRPAVFALCGILGFTAVLTPWTIRNYQVFHKVFFVRDNLGLELYGSNNDEAQESFEQNRASGLHQRVHPNVSPVEAQELVRLGEIEYNRRRMATALAWMRGNPGKFLRLTAARARMFWFPYAEGRPFYALSVSLVTLLSIGGLGLLAWRRRPILLFLLAVVILYPPLYYLVQEDPRYPGPMLWISIVSAGYLLSDLYSRARRSLETRATASSALQLP